MSLNKTTLSLVVNGNSTLTATVAPDNATNKAVTWSSNNTGVATVDSSGKVTAKAVGTATITAASSADSGKKATCTVTVTKGTVSNVTYTVSSDKVLNLSGSSFYNVCAAYTGYALSYIKYTSIPTSHGTLVYDYSNGSYSSKIGTSNSYYYTGSGSTRRIDNITFVPDGSRTGNVTFAYTGWDTQGASYTGYLVISVDGPSGDISYKTGRNESIGFDGSDFQAMCKKLVGGTLDYVKFTQPSSSYGTLYYDYDGSDERKVNSKSNDKYYYNDSPDIDDVTFVPAKNKSGTVSISFTGYNTKDQSFSGTIEVSVSSSGTSDIVYKIDENETVDLKSSDFTSFCKDATGSSGIEWIKFTQPSSSKGTLYYKYDSSKEEEVSHKDEYYTSGSPKISDITFVPYKNYSGTVTIDFEGENTGGKSFSGSFTVKVGASSSDGDVTYKAAAGSAVTFQAADFNSYCKSETGYNLDYVKFSSLPSSSTGTLYYDYSSSGNNNKAVTTSTQYKRSSSSYLDRVTFVPAKSAAGTVEIRFTGKNTDGDSFSGTVTITYTAVKDAGVIRYSTGGGALILKVSDFDTACNNRGAGTLNSVRFNLPSSAVGTLYYNYTSSGKYDSLVMPGVDYGARSGNLLLSYVSFVPAVGFTGTTTLSYTGTDSKGSTYNGTIEITVTQANAKPDFTDMGNYAWAADAVEYLYQKGITTGTTTTTYGPAGKITRGDFVLMLQRAFSLTASIGDNFTDVPSNAYYAQAIAVAKVMGIAQGGADNTFNPTGALTREDAMVLLQRTLNRTGRAVADADTSYLDQFPDGKNVSSYAKGAVAALVQAGVIKGDDSGKLNPRGTLTRAEMAVILHRVLTK